MRWLLALVLATSPAASRAGWYECAARGLSHTGHYTFRISLSPCKLYWAEVDRDLRNTRCAPPVIVATKPFAVSSGWELRFDLATGYFEDFTPSFSDRGHCVAVAVESKPGQLRDPDGAVVLRIHDALDILSHKVGNRPGR